MPMSTEQTAVVLGGSMTSRMLVVSLGICKHVTLMQAGKCREAAEEALQAPLPVVQVPCSDARAHI